MDVHEYYNNLPAEGGKCLEKGVPFSNTVKVPIVRMFPPTVGLSFTVIIVSPQYFLGGKGADYLQW